MASKFYGVDPDVVDYEWSYLDWLDRVEYMYVQNEIDQRFVEDD